MVIAAHVEPVAAVCLLFEAHEEKQTNTESVEEPEIIHLSGIAFDAKKQSTRRKLRQCDSYYNRDSGLLDHI